MPASIVPRLLPALGGLLVLAASTCVAAPNYCISGEFVLGCITEKQFDDIAAYRNNETGFRDAIMLNIKAGTCSVFKDGELVSLVNHSKDHLAVRRPDGGDVYWTFPGWTKPIADCKAPPQPVETARATPARAPSARKATTEAPPAPKGESSAEAPPAPKAESSACVFKPVMTDEDLAVCRKARQ